MLDEYGEWHATKSDFGVGMVVGHSDQNAFDVGHVGY